MGEAKRRKEAVARDPIVYHHTSTLRTNLLWMAGVVAVEGGDEPVYHPRLGKLQTDTKMRRAMQDFPPLAWFTTQIECPKCLTDAPVYGVNPETGERIDISVGPGAMNPIALQRIALAFRVADIPVVRWTDHPGYDTAEGRELNASALDYGDDPTDWYVSEQPVDLMLVSEVWSSASIMKPKYERIPEYLPQMKRMVERCRAEKVYIPPSWLKPDEAKALAKQLGKEARSADQL